MAKNAPIIVVYSISPDFLEMTFLSMASCKANSKHQMEFYIFIDSECMLGIEPRCHKFSKALDCSIIVRLMEEIPNLPRSSFKLKRSKFFRYLAPAIVSKTKIAIYIDADTIILGDLAELVNYELGDLGIGACLDVVAPNRNFQDHSCSYHNTANTCRYFNSGFMVFDPSRWRQKSGQMFDSFKSAATYSYPDQDTLNIGFHQDIAELPVEWNVPPIRSLLHSRTIGSALLENYSRGFLENLELRAKMIHFIANTKPGRGRYPEEGPAYAEYYRLRKLFGELLV